MSDKDKRESHRRGERQPHEDHHKHMLMDFKRRFLVSVAASIPVLLLSPMVQSIIGMEYQFTGSIYLLLGISSFIYIYGGWPFLKGLVDELGERQPGMMTLVGVAISVAYMYSAAVVLVMEGKVFFWELVTLIDVMLLGHWVEMKSVMGASRALEEMARLMPSEAHLVRKDGSTEDVSIEDISEGDRVMVKPGERVPVDGEIVDGASEIDESMITGESEPVAREKGDEVVGGSVNGNGSLTVQVRKAGEESYVAQVVNMVREASESKSKAQGLADRAAFWLTVIAISAGVITLAGWLSYGKDLQFSLERMVTVMVVTCPHALGLAIPLVIAVITTLAAKNGLLIRNRTPFEAARNVQVIIFDKTGTLTKGAFRVTDVIGFGDWDGARILKAASSVELNSEHTIGRGVVEKAREENIGFTKAEKFEAIPGKGARAEVDGQTVYVGNRKIADSMGIGLGDAEQKIHQLSSAGKTTVIVASEDRVQGIIALEDEIRDESREAVSELKRRGIEVAMITGDNEATAKHVARELGVETYFADVLPDEKSEKVKELQREDKKVAMVGDGVNDAPALAQADVGIAIGAGTDVAVETADVILVESDPRNAVDVLSLAEITNRKMVQNLVWATGYNVVAIPLAAGVLFGYGIILPPAVGALIMSVSTVIVAINARLVHYGKRK